MDELNYEKFLIYLRMFQNKIQKSFNENLKKLGISSTHVGIIMILKTTKEGLPMSSLSRLTKVDNALMTRNIKELEKIKYIYRNRENDSQRKYNICLTEQGYQVADIVQQIMEEKQKRFQEQFTKEERKTLEQGIQILLKKVINIVEKEEKEC